MAEEMDGTSLETFHAFSEKESGVMNVDRLPCSRHNMVVVVRSSGDVAWSEVGKPHCRTSLRLNAAMLPTYLSCERLKRGLRTHP